MWFPDDNRSNLKWVGTLALVVGVYCAIEVVLPTEDKYQAFLSSFESPFWLFLLGTVSIHVGQYMLVNLFFGLVFASGMFTQYEIQPGKRSPPELIRWCVVVAAFNLLIVQTALLASGWPLYGLLGLDVTGAVPSAAEVCKSLVVCFLVEDTLFYWSHRMLHSKMLYARIHKMHHQFKIPNGLAAEYAHPLEYIISNATPYAAGPLVAGLVFGRCHVLTTWVWGFLRVWEAVDGHSGYALPFSPWSFIPFRPSAADHDWHHSNNAGNFASFFQWWDHFQGTSRVCVDTKLKAKKG